MNIVQNNEDSDDNGWTEPNVEILRNWRNNLSKTSFIYQHVLHKYQLRLNRLLVVSLLLSTMSALLASISTLSLTRNEELYRFLSLAMSGTIFILAAITTIINGMIKIYKFEDIITSFSAFVDKIDNMCSTISAQLILPNKMKEQSLVFIKSCNESYSQIIKSAPMVDQNDFEVAKSSYEKFRKNEAINYKQKCKDHIIDLDNDVLGIGVQ